MIIAPAELELTRPNIFTKLPDFTTRTTEYDIATRSKPIGTWLPCSLLSPVSHFLFFFFFSYPRSTVTAGAYTAETAVMLFIP